MYGNYCLSRTDKEPQKKKKNKNEVAGHLSAAWRKCKQSEFANTLKVNKRRWDISQYQSMRSATPTHMILKKSKRNNETERAWHEVWNLVKNTNTLTKEKHYSIHSNVVIRSGVWICSIMSCTVKTQIKNDRMTEKWPMDEKKDGSVYLPKSNKVFVKAKQQRMMILFI